MSGPDFVVVSIDDWQALFVNGEKVMEGHQLSLEETVNYVLKEQGMKPVVFKYGTPEFENYCQESGSFPDVLPDEKLLC